MTEPDSPSRPLLSRIIETVLRGDVAILLVILSLALGGAALLLTPREEEPQIVVPLADVLVRAPGLSAEEVEQKVTRRLEKLLFQIDGVEYVYSMSKPGQAVVTVRFFVGEDREDSLVKLYNKIHSNVDQVPKDVQDWVVKPIEVDDVPIVNVTLWSEQPERYGDYELRRLAEELQHELQAITNTNQVSVIGGRPRQIRVFIDPGRLAARQMSPFQAADALRASNVNYRAGDFDQQDQQFVVEAGTFVRNARALGNLVVGVSGNRPVYLKDVARVVDGPAEVDSYTWMAFGPAARAPHDPKDRGPAAAEAGADIYGKVFPAVHIAVAKRKGSNAVWVAEGVQRRMQELAATGLLPDGVHYRITRDYGETANAKVNDLVASLAVAVVTVIALIGVIIGWRAALVIALAVPVCYSITLFVNLLAGYTINRVTLFALILSLGLLVDDPITDVENIVRYFGMKKLKPREATVKAIQEVQPALILSTLAIIASFVPLMFITGMMGPYMAPMALNVPLTVTVSTFVALFITPWVAMVALRRLAEKKEGEPEYDPTGGILYRLSRAILGPVLKSRVASWSVLGGVAALLAATMAVPAFRVVPLKMLPYDNKNEFQIVIDMPEGSTLERTDAVTRQLGGYLAGVSEVTDLQMYVGLASPMDFNGMVRHYFLRQGAHLADIRVNLAPKDNRAQQSHAILLRLRDDLTAIAEAAGANIKLVEVPPGPPVIATVTAEVYGPPDARYDELITAARHVEARMKREPLLVDIDISAEADQPKVIFETDQPKAALSGVAKHDVAQTINLALEGLPTTVLQVPGEVNPLWVNLEIDRAKRSALDDLRELYVRGQQGQMVQIGALGEFLAERDGQPILEGKTIYRKNLRRVVYVFADVAGRPPADAIIDIIVDQLPDGDCPNFRGTAADAGSNPPAEAAKMGLSPSPAEPRPVAARTWLRPGGGVPWSMPPGFTAEWAGEGEWKITLDVFRDLGLAFAAALAGIFVVLMFQTGSRLLPVVIMLAIPLTLIGIMPGFWLLNLIVDRPVGGYPNPVFFTATAMIGMIALGGIVVRNSVVLIDFINQAVAEGTPMREAVIQSVAVRTRPIVLTAGTTLLGNWVITLDPIFSGLAWAIIFGILTSTVFTLLVIPVVYWLVYGRESTSTPAPP
ncbi:MAG: efflux RND transporter permease subunit [Thermoguttaceae bacterium]|jgi:multidrug efflux pump subunit AcrB|nr:efflux RND transporter permease subunit [Thermoguttaceae bacterium]